MSHQSTHQSPHGDQHRQSAVDARNALLRHRGAAAEPKDDRALQRDLQTRRTHRIAEVNAARFEALAAGAVAKAMSSLVETCLSEVAQLAETTDGTAELKLIKSVLAKGPESDILHNILQSDIARAEHHIRWAQALDGTHGGEHYDRIGQQASMRIPLQAVVKLVKNARDSGASRSSQIVPDTSAGAG